MAEAKEITPRIEFVPVEESLATGYYVGKPGDGTKVRMKSRSEEGTILEVIEFIGIRKTVVGVEVIKSQHPKLGPPVGKRFSWPISDLEVVS